MPNLICDTNIFYNVGLNRINPSDFSKTGDTIYYSPITVMELAGKLSQETYEDRKAAAGAILKLGAILLLDPESYLTDLFGLTSNSLPNNNFGVIIKNISQSESFDQIERGVPDLDNNQIVSVDTDVAKAGRSDVEEHWIKDLLGIMIKDIPGFERWFNEIYKKKNNRSVPKLRENMKPDFLKMITKTEWKEALIFGLYVRACLKAGRNMVPSQTLQSKPRFVRVKKSLECYCSMYSQYLVRILFEGMLPKRNDRGDIEFFLYTSDDNFKIVTGDKKWRDIADQVGFGNRVEFIGQV